jgi:hypothetical protein
MTPGIQARMHSKILIQSVWLQPVSRKTGRGGKMMASRQRKMVARIIAAI